MPSEHFDDPNIPGTERLFRRINLVHIVEGEGGSSVVSSAAFRDLELSINLESVMQAAGRAAEQSLRDYPNDLLMGITAGHCRNHGQLVGPDPIPEEPAHGYAFGKKTKAVQRALRDAAEWVVPGTRPPYDEIHKRKVQLGLLSGNGVD